MISCTEWGRGHLELRDVARNFSWAVNAIKWKLSSEKVDLGQERTHAPSPLVAERSSSLGEGATRPEDGPTGCRACPEHGEADGDLGQSELPVAAPPEDQSGGALGARALATASRRQDSLASLWCLWLMSVVPCW